jgi:hypothetical protein
VPEALSKRANKQQSDGDIGWKLGWGLAIASIVLWGAGAVFALGMFLTAVPK